MKLKSKVALVTGASSGIGKAVTKVLNLTGMRLVLTARREDRLRKLAAECRNAVYHVADIADPEAPAHLINRGIDAFGRVDVVVNNAGNMVAGTIDELDLDEMARMVELNVTATFRMMYTALRHFKSLGSGQLVNISSILGTKVRETAGAYAGTKHAVEALTEALRMELAGTNVGICCVEPGLVLTELHDKWDVHPRESLGIDPPLAPEDVARAVKFVLEQPEHVRIPRIMVLPGAHRI